MSATPILPRTGNEAWWRGFGRTLSEKPKAPSTTLRAVPLPEPGRI